MLRLGAAAIFLQKNSAAVEKIYLRPLRCTKYEAAELRKSAVKNRSKLPRYRKLYYLFTRLILGLQYKELPRNLNAIGWSGQEFPSFK
eukprot:1842327-Pleurochrysis_carterae.AAC.1